jgi:hypothetical protein
MQIKNVHGVWYASYRNRDRGIYIVTGAPTRDRAIAKGLFMLMGYDTPRAI